MKTSTGSGIAALVAAGGVMAAGQGASIEFRALSSDAAKADATVPWVKDGSDAWATGQPLFTLGDAGTPGFAAQAWVGVTTSRLHVRVVVDDAHPVNAPDNVRLWAADGIELCLDMRGDQSGRLPRDTPGVMGPDDAKFMFALTDAGMVGRCMQADRDANTGLVPAEWARGGHDPQTGKTTYELELPWTRFETAPGLFPSFGMALQINDLDLESTERALHNWGEGTFGNMRPGLFKTVAVGPAPEPRTASVINRAVVWSPAEAAEVVVALTGAGDYGIEAVLGGQKREQRVTGTDVLQRFAVRLYPGDGDAREVPFAVRLVGKGGVVLQEQAGTAVLVAPVYRALMQRIDEALETATQPLFRRHLLSVKAIVTDEWARLALYQEYGQRGDARKSFEYLRNLLAGFESDAGKWETYLDGKRDLYMAYLSRVDRTVQFYALSLPHDWVPTREYPLFVELHGSGNENFLSDVSVRLGGDSGTLDLNGYATHRTSVQRRGAGYWIMPSGRGNLGYRGPGEDDVWEAYDDVHAQFKIDPDRRYLFGFSMGGGGTWSLGTRTPDRWAALMIMAGGLWREPTGLGLGRNINYVPTYVWCGEKDELCSQYVPVFRAEIEKYGGNLTVKTVPELAHSYTVEVQDECAAWLVQQVRKRPDTFSYVADTERHLGAWGITLVRDLRFSGAPSFTCTVKDGAVSILSEGTPGLTVVLGEGGLGLKDDATVEWNGTRVYEGPVKTVTVGEVPKGRGRE